MSIFSYIRSHVVVSSVIVAAAVFIGVVGGRAATHKAPAANTSDVKEVTLVNAATFRKGNLSVSADGIVESHSQADLKSQLSAPVSVIYASIGESVYAGEAILELQNSDIRAQLSQAQASLVLAQGQYNSTRQSAIDKIKSAYLAADSAVHTQIDQLILNNTQTQPQLFTFVSDPGIIFKIRDQRTDITNAFIAWKPVVDALSASSTDDAIHTAISMSQNDLSLVSSLLDDISAVLNDAANKALPPTLPTINSLLAIVNGARNSIVAANANLTSAATAITGPGSGTTPAQAQVSVAQAGVSALQAQLAKTILRSPIDGKVSALPLRTGELASPGSLLASVIGNDSGLIIKSYVSGDDLSRVAIGAQVTIDSPSGQTSSSTASHIRGVVSNIAPGVDAITKKAEVDIDVSDPTHSGLVIGQNVSVSVASAPLGGQANSDGSSGASGSQGYLLPIQDVKIIPGAAFVYTVDANSKIVRHDVIIGQIQGDFIEVMSGLSDDMNIVTPVYELDEGQEVKVQ